jgi:hypothetical protein
VALFLASLCRMHNGGLVPYETATIDTNSTQEAVEKARRWGAETVENRDGIWLQVMLDGASAACFKPGEF